MPITIRELYTLQDAAAFQQVERFVWGSDDESLVPTHILITLANNGGLVLGAFDEDGPAATHNLVGIALGWYGKAMPNGESEARIKLCSHMAGVLPAWQRKRVGLALKLAQREWLQRDGVTDWVTWTYDPLYRANGVFNIHRLGAICSTYIVDLYGEMTDVLNAGGPSDRCQVDWWVESPRVRNAVAAASQSDGAAAQSGLHDYPTLSPTHTKVLGHLRQPSETPLNFDGRAVGAPVPDDISAIRRQDRSLALAWRFALRNHLQSAYAAGYVLVDCLQVGDGEWNYVLVPGDSVLGGRHGDLK
jgi:predicted GNAT superfamily acetyltransferase